jgi:phosphatidylserine decarboxylase precursor
MPYFASQSLGFPELEITWHPRLGSWAPIGPGTWPAFVRDALANNAQVFRQRNIREALSRGVSTQLIATQLVVVLYQQAAGRNPGRWYVENIPKKAITGLHKIYNPGADTFAAAKYLNWLQAVGWSKGVTTGYFAGEGYWYSEDPALKKKKILHYMQDYNVDLSEVEMTPPCNKFMPEDWKQNYAKEHECFLTAVDYFKTYNHFFYRKLRSGKRKFLCYSSDKSVCERTDRGLRRHKSMISPADSRVMALPTFNPMLTSIWVKGEPFTLENMVKLKSAGAYRYFEDGVVLIFRLAPQDYHRFHFPVDGTIKHFENYPGNHYSVNPIAITDDAHPFYGKGNHYHQTTSTPVFTTNKRMHVGIDTEDFGCVLYISVGATNVASVIHTSYVGQEVVRGMEHGYMAYGGSTVLVVLRKGVIELNKELTMMSSVPVETIMRMGDHIGYRKHPADPPVHGSENPCA